MIVQWFVLVASLGLASCHHKDTLNVSLIEPWSEKLQTSFSCAIPFVGYYGENDNLIFLAATHSSATNDKTHRLIKKLVAAEQPSVVIVEGLTGDSLQHNLSYPIEAIECSKGCPENLYAYWLSAKTGARVKGGEPNDKFIMKSLANKYQPTDLLFLYILRQIPHFSQDIKNNTELTEKHCQMLAKAYVENFGLAINYRFSDFAKHYQALFGKPFEPNSIDSNDIAPIADGDFIQRLSYEVGLLRDASLARHIMSCTREKHKVLVVYGGSHLVQLHKLLVKAFNGQFRHDCATEYDIIRP